MSGAVGRTCEIAKALRGKGQHQARCFLVIVRRMRTRTISDTFCSQGEAEGILKGIRRRTDASRERTLPCCSDATYWIQPLSGHRESQRSLRENREDHWLETYEIELEHPELADMPEAIEKVESILYGMTAD
jgi:hypothetical protein